jgi:hypothetical protein
MAGELDQISAAIGELRGEVRTLGTTMQETKRDLIRELEQHRERTHDENNRKAAIIAATELKVERLSAKVIEIETEKRVNKWWIGGIGGAAGFGLSQVFGPLAKKLGLQ